ncbi:MAG: ABC transporter ATP-binding protein [Coriobacteriia bacterium]|nr:ABC transporter ATP-binding protein [Coriobacteriia bacterium]
MFELAGAEKTVSLPGGKPLRVVRDVSFAVSAGESVAILGRSGSGKSTLLGILGLIDSLDAGSYMVDGCETTRLGDRQLARRRSQDFGFVFQRFCLMGGLSALKNVEAPLLYSQSARKGRHRTAMEALDRVGLADRAHHRPERLSGGEQQRVAIARALVHRPRVILADEPTGSLDVATGGEVLSLLTGLVRDDAATLIMVTHDPQLAARLDRTLHMDEGRLSEST